MYQAGIKNITLIEDKAVGWTYYDPTDLYKISNLTYSAGAIVIENCQFPKFEVKVTIGDRGKLLYNYSLEFILMAYITENIDSLEQLQESIYGWIMLVEYYDGTYKLYPSPIFFNETDFKPQDEMNFFVKMKSGTPTEQRYFEYTPGISTVVAYRADTTLLTADSILYTADYSL